MAEVQAQRAEKIAKDALKKLEAIMSRLEKSGFSSSAPRSNSTSPSLSTLSEPEEILITIKQQPRQQQRQQSYHWVIPHDDITIGTKELGRGRWGVVKVATYNNEEVAARGLYSRIVTEENRHVFMESMDMAAKMSHPNILPLLGVAIEREPVILTELMPTSLKKIVDSEKLLNYQVVKLAIDVAQGLNYLHSFRPTPVFHGDIASTGVLVRKESGNQWHAKLSDFMGVTFFHQVIMSGGGGDLEGYNDEGRIMSPTRLTGSRMNLTPLSNLYKQKKISASDLSINKRLSGRKLSLTPHDVLDGSPLTMERDVYSYGFLLVELCTGTQPLEISFQFLTESITWSAMGAMIKLCTDHKPSNRPTMNTVINGMVKMQKVLTIARPSKINMTIAT